MRPYAIVLGNRVFPDGAPCAELAARLKTTLALYRAGRAPKIIVSGGVRGAYDEPRAMAAWLEARGVPPADVIATRAATARPRRWRTRRRWACARRWS